MRTVRNGAKENIMQTLKQANGYIGTRAEKNGALFIMIPEQIQAGMKQDKWKNWVMLLMARWMANGHYWYQNGQLKEETIYKNGVKEGKSVSFFDNADKEFEGIYHNDSLEGYATWWNKNSNKDMEGKSIRGLQDSIWILLSSLMEK